jgi:hypothetical protein
MNKLLRVLALVLLSLTAAFTLLGGAGTTCVAFNAENFGESMAKLVPVKPIFQILVFVSIAAALFGATTIFRLARGKSGAFVQALIFLVVGGAASGVQFYYSLTLRGSTAPNNIRLYVTLLTLAVFLLLRLPGIWQKTGFEQGQKTPGMGKPAGAALIVCGLLTLAMPIWGAPTHVIAGVNTVNVLLAPLMGLGIALCGGGLALWIAGRGEKGNREVLRRDVAKPHWS